MVAFGIYLCFCRPRCEAGITYLLYAEDVLGWVSPGDGNAFYRKRGGCKGQLGWLWTVHNSDMDVCTRAAESRLA